MVGVVKESVSAIPILLSLMVGFLLGLVAWGLLRLRHRQEDDSGTISDDALLALLALATFALGAFFTYVLFGIHW